MAGLLAGLMTEDLRMGVVQGFLSIPAGLVIAFALAISPVLTGFLEVQVDDIFSFITRLGLPIYLFALPLYIVTGIAGMLLRERFGLRSRLEARGWPPEKVRENVEAEAIDVILQGAVGRLAFVYEIDTTTLTAEQTATAVLGILQGKAEGHAPGSVDWSEEVLSWY